MNSRTWKALGVLRAGAALPLLGISLQRAGTAPGTGFLGEFEASSAGALELEGLETWKASSLEKNSTVSSEISNKRASASLVVESEWDSRDRRSKNS